MRLCLGIFVALGLSVMGVRASEPSGTLLKARILQLEGQLQRVASENAVCTARLAMATKDAADAQQVKQRHELEQEAGCSIDWAMTPPACKPAP